MEGKVFQFKKKYKDFTSTAQAKRTLGKIVGGDETALIYTEVMNSVKGMPTFIYELIADDGEVINSFRHMPNPFALPCMFNFWSREAATKNHPYEILKAA